MKHLVILLAVAFGVFAVWQFASPAQRRWIIDSLHRHALKLGVLLAILLALLALAYYFPAIAIL